MTQCSTLSFKGQIIFCGIDVHKSSWKVHLRHCHRDLDKFSMNPSPEGLADYLKKNYPDAEYRSVYEAGFSGFEAHRALCSLGIYNIVINPADVPTTGRDREYKNDSADCKKLAMALESGMLEPIYIPSREQLGLRNLVRRENQVVKDIVRVKNRIKGHLFFNGIKFLSWSGRSLKTLEIAAKKNEDFALLSLLRELNYLRLERLQIVNDEKKYLKNHNREEVQIHLQSIPGIGFRTAVILQSELWDMGRFRDKEHLGSYSGVAPHLVGSGEHEFVRACGNRKLKQLHSVLIEAAWRSVSFDMEQRARYGRLLAKGANPQRAISIIAKKLLYTVRAVWMQNRDYIKIEAVQTVKNC